MGKHALVTYQAHFTGASHEYHAAGWYLARGYQVYWPSCQQGIVDFVIEKKGRFSRVQVKTATWSKAGKYKYLQCRTRSRNKCGSFKPKDAYDIFFIVGKESMWEIPAQVIRGTNICLGGSNPSYRTTKWEQFKIKKDY